MILGNISCTNQAGTEQKDDVSAISQKVLASTTELMKQKFSDLANQELMIAGIEQLAQQWRAEDGSAEEFASFCMENFAAAPEAKKMLFNKLSIAFESLWGGYNKMSVDLKKPLHLDGDPLASIDYIFGAYDPSSHLTEDLYSNKIAYITMLNFPYFTLVQKDEKASEWNRLDWAYARMGDIFTPKAPAAVKQMVADAEMRAESYIAEYNIMMGHIVNEKGVKLFPEDMKLLSHWNLRDEIKSNYAAGPDNMEKQKIIYKIMMHIVEQTIPQQVINNPEYDWAPYANTITKGGVSEEVKQKGDRRYEVLLDQFKAQKAMDKYSFANPTAILRAFDGSMQIRQEEIEKMFIEYISSPKVLKVAEMIKERLGRPLEPFDIWYDGFKSRSSISEEMLTKKTKSLYPTAQAFDKDIPAMLVKFGFPARKAEELGGAIVVEAARGSGHAWGAQSRDDFARLRTRLAAGGMDYKGFNIAVHEMGHNVEQTISMRDVDYYMLNGVPNTAFTEANAFVFQKRDLTLLGYNQKNPDQEKMTELDIFWGSYEIMGVALVDMNVWKWLYENPEATPTQLKEAVITIAKDIWNKYYSPVLGEKDTPLLAIYSHMINSPLYLANYPLGHIIEYQLEKFYAKKIWSEEVMRIYAIGNVTPQQWMLQAVGEKISTKAMLED
ncbi:MAG: hypothetical protein A2X18_04395 [Bacteroidetes bacterium GWF2_40_14]|nr:MAG: hypothetical protein A2X18_04395 [Bacteroidetes bacterium GWF2_40_14]